MHLFDGSGAAIIDSENINEELLGRQWNPTVTQLMKVDGDRFLVIWSGNGLGYTAGVFTR
ncbi:hypothetical protein [Polystyrenella longa]|uniref:hypothetical protein n=1 Tax=Polystyrenella longa TaxID=2528007 RepID=UPI0011A4378F|nr:hypothetical protein [Polystyrenella longa]